MRDDDLVSVVDGEDEFLVCYDYGMGGIWAVVLAPSAAAITRKYPEVFIPSDRPGWMTDEHFERIRANTRDRLDGPPTTFFKAILADRDR